MALTEEQLEQIAISVSQRVSCQLNFEDAIELVRGVVAALPKPEVVVPDLLFDGYSVLMALSDSQRARTSPENVSDTLDAVVRMLRAEAPIAQPASAPSEQKPECPYPCGWENLYSLIVSNGALIVRSIDPDSVSDSTWAAISNTIEHAKELCKHGMSNHDYKAQRDALMGVLNKARNALVQWHVPENRYSAIESIDAAILSVKGGA